MDGIEPGFSVRMGGEVGSTCCVGLDHAKGHGGGASSTAEILIWELGF
jgi:hypothetical protein